MAIINVHKNSKVVGYSIFGVVFYGKLSNNYHIEILLPVFDKVITLWKSKKRPMLRSLYVLAILTSPITLTHLLLEIIIVTCILLTTFYVRTLFQKSFITDSDEIISGWISLILSMVGIAAIISYLL